ncbi:hypothetical protein SynROS8604_02414 [Synechococcus sp. ROS8604]|nr:hypothetical protein SynROS8604_02414 [Synechococcus sp. ROS8604]
MTADIRSRLGLVGFDASLARCIQQLSRLCDGGDWLCMEALVQHSLNDAY